ncbi:MAG: hypothetical protein OXC98_06305 [bacterium]|nr:hypothetical protein [Acidimicrobiia bacterium]MCY4649962.1 hypothetical protein [bacterium]
MITWVHTYRPRSDWYHQTPQTRDRLLADWEGAAAASISKGATRKGPLSIRGQSRQEHLEIWTFLDLQELEDHWTRLRKLGYTDWRESENTVATEIVKSKLTGPGS